MHSSSFYHLRYEISFIDKYFAFPVYYVGNKIWFHVVVNYRANESRMEVYYNGERRYSASGSFPNSFSPGNGIVQIGRRYTDTASRYTSMEADDLLFFNTSLTQSDITAIYDMY